jgi:hypothetical protein
LGAIMAMKALVSADRPVVRIWHPDDPKQYVELQFEGQEAANNAVGHLNSALKWASGMELAADGWLIAVANMQVRFCDRAFPAWPSQNSTAVSERNCSEGVDGAEERQRWTIRESLEVVDRRSAADRCSA